MSVLYYCTLQDCDIIKEYPASLKKRAAHSTKPWYPHTTRLDGVIIEKSKIRIIIMKTNISPSIKAECVVGPPSCVRYIT
jgi:hypothetical protein